MERFPVEKTLFTWPAEEPRLRGIRCQDCGALAFPLRESCPGCGGLVDEELLPREGQIWSVTTQEFTLKWPYEGPDEPFVVGYVDLGDIKVESRIDVPVETVHTRARIGTRVALQILPFGDDRLTFAFRPTEGTA